MGEWRVKGIRKLSDSHCSMCTISKVYPPHALPVCNILCNIEIHAIWVRSFLKETFYNQNQEQKGPLNKVRSISDRDPWRTSCKLMHEWTGLARREVEQRDGSIDRSTGNFRCIRTVAQTLWGVLNASLGTSWQSTSGENGCLSLFKGTLGNWFRLIKSPLHNIPHTYPKKRCASTYQCSYTSTGEPYQLLMLQTSIEQSP